MGVVYFGPIFRTACITCVYCVLLPYGIGNGIINKKRQSYVGLYGCASARICRSTCQLSHCGGLVFILPTV